MKSFFSSLKKLFFSGLAVIVPIIVTFWLLKLIIVSTDSFIMSFFPDSIQPKTILGYELPGIGIVFTFFLIIIAGALTRFYLGRYLVSLGDKLISRIPLGRSIYHAVKQFISAVSSGGRVNFKQVVAVEFPKDGFYAIGFVTGEAIKEVSEFHGGSLVNVFVPTSPNPTSGFTLMMPRNKTIPLAISVDEAFKIIVSGGVVK